MELRTETTYLIDDRGSPYSMVDQWQDFWVLDVNGEPTDEIESLLVSSFRRGQEDVEITEDEYLELLPAYKAEQEAQEVAAAERFAKQSAAHSRAMDGAVAKLKGLGLTKAEAEAVVGLPMEELMALGVVAETDDAS